MERSPLEVRGWVSGLNFVIAAGVMLIGVAGVVSAFREIAASGLTPTAVSELTMGLGLPVGIYLFRRTAKRWREDTSEGREG